jgi:acetate kinase
MGFTAADGLPMGTHCGNADPGVTLYQTDEPMIAGHTRRSIAGR